MARPRAGRARAPRSTRSARSRPGPVRAVLGPCVHPARYEFGADLLDRLVARLGPEVAARTDDRHARARHPGRGARRRSPRPGSTTSTTSTCAPRRRPTTSRTAATASPVARPWSWCATRERPSPTVATRWPRCGARIAAAAARAGRDPATVTLVAATKTVDAERGRRRSSTPGCVDLGENRAQELLAKAAALAGRRRRRWHFLGQLQRNKVRALAPWVACWQSVDRPELGAEIARRAPGRPGARRGEPGGGAAEGRLRARRGAGARRRAPRPTGLDVAGLMTVPPARRRPPPLVRARCASRPPRSSSPSCRWA